MSNDMIHIVLFKLDPEKFAAEFPGDELRKAVQKLEKVIPGLMNVTLTPKPSQKGEKGKSGSGYNYILVSKHLDAAALKVYADHPDHKALQARIMKCSLVSPLRVDVNISAKL